ncbi:MAG TPA: enoyl-CoA hydratase [Myxococcota bacterium]
MESRSAEANCLLLRDDRDGVTTLSLNRPNQANALSEELIAALQTALDSVGPDAGVRVVVIAAEGRAFSAGHDLKQMRSHPERGYYEALFGRCRRLMTSLREIPQPVIAKVQGLATAAGCQLVASCDLAVASSDARFATSGINVGLFCATPAVPLSRDVSRKRAFEMLMTGGFIDAETARDWGLVNRVVPPDQLDAEVAALAREIASKSRVAVETGKRMFHRQLEMTLDEATAYAAEVMARNMLAEDAGEGIDAFIGKRAPVWKGR